MEYTWEIINMKRNSSDDGVFEVQYRVWILRGTYETEISGMVELVPDPSSASYTAYADLTQDQVIAWVKTVVGASNVEAIALERLNKLHPPADVTPVVSSGIPWGAAE
jgi:hypothetical protein|tara:strand:- start:41 stop:364 length:324 start_codon:yes stop_codon:yes gene_type:complete